MWISWSRTRGIPHSSCTKKGWGFRGSWASSSIAIREKTISAVPKENRERKTSHLLAVRHPDIQAVRFCDVKTYILTATNVVPTQGAILTHKMGMTRRTFLLSVGASGLVTGCGGGSSTATSSGTSGGTTSGGTTPPATMKVPLTIDLSKANLPSGASTVAYAYIIGGLYSDAALTTFECYRLDASGVVHAIAPTDNSVPANSFPDPNGVVNAADTSTINTTYPQSWADYSIPLSVTTPNFIELGNINPANIPGLGTGNNALSMRVYISLGIPKLPFTAQAAYLAGSVTHANPYAGPGFDTGSPGALCMFDWFECSIDSGGVLNGNPTYVDQFGMPLVVVAQPGTTAQGELTISRQQVLTNIAAFPTLVYAGLTQSVTASTAYPAGTGYLRAISPDHLAGLSGTPGAGAGFNTYFDNVINFWNGKTITVTDGASGTYTGTPSPGNWVFHNGSSTLTYTDVTTANIWKCGGTLASGSTAQQNIGKQILAAFNRGQMSDSSLSSISLSDSNCPNPVPDPYYKFDPSNLWAKSFHTWSKNGLAYGFAYDDVCAANPSFTTTGALTSLSITLGTMF